MTRLYAWTPIRARWRGILGFLAMGTTAFLADFTTKRWAVQHLSTDSVHTVINGWLQWQLYLNPGASFGLLSGHAAFLVWVGILAWCILLYWGGITADLILAIGLGMIWGGTAGNLYDRLVFGHVRDFIWLWPWPAIFNVADLGIRIGAAVVGMRLLKRQGRAAQTP